MKGEVMTRYLWCLHCERTWINPVPMESRSPGEASLDECPYSDCDGGVFDSHDYEWPCRCNPSYPEAPKPGARYPLYPQPKVTRKIERELNRLDDEACEEWEAAWVKRVGG